MTDLPYTRRNVSKGRVYWRFRSKETGDVPLPGCPEDLAFHERYTEMLRLRAAILEGTRPEGSFAALIDKYQKSAEYLALADSTQADYARTLLLIEAEMVDPCTRASLPYRLVTRAMIKAVRDDHAKTPRAAHKIKQMVSRLYSWAQEESLVAEGFNPAAGLKRLKRKGGDREIVPWSDPEIAWVLKAAPAHVKTPVMIALYTGQRRRDVREMTWQQWQGDLVRVRTSKTRQLIDMPCHPALKSHLEAVKKRMGAIPFHTAPICLNATGKPWPTDDAMSGALRRVVEGIAQMPNNRSMHGLRYAAAARMNEGGADAATIQEVLGHRTFRMAMKYASGRLRAALGIAAMGGQE